jgi:hypothetical protein
MKEELKQIDKNRNIGKKFELITNNANTPN